MWHMEICHKDTGYRVYMVKHGWFICNALLSSVTQGEERLKTVPVFCPLLCQWHTCL